MSEYVSYRPEVKLALSLRDSIDMPVHPLIEKMSRYMCVSSGCGHGDNPIYALNDELCSCFPDECLHGADAHKVISGYRWQEEKRRAMMAIHALLDLCDDGDLLIGMMKEAISIKRQLSS